MMVAACKCISVSVFDGLKNYVASVTRHMTCTCSMTSSPSHESILGWAGGCREEGSLVRETTEVCGGMG